MTAPTPEIAARLRELPSVDRVAEALDSDLPHGVRVEAAREGVIAAREMVLDGYQVWSFDRIVEVAKGWVPRHAYRSLQRVINATGVLLHTNLGRAPMDQSQLGGISAYSNLEYDLEKGTRGDRYRHSTSLLARLTGAEDSLVVNNNAAAVLLVLSTLCADREVVISRGELVEIGGEFRIPDVMKTARARLVEVGTTNRTHVADYERAITPDTAALMKVHASNYKVIGFTKSVDRRGLGRLAKGRGVHFIEDLGSGLITFDEATSWTRDEPPVATSIESGADIVTFSGDKLLGGPQAGLIVGRKELIDRLKKNPLLRALRVDKMTLAALQATLEKYANGTWRELPLWKMALADAADLETAAREAIEFVDEHITSLGKLEAVPMMSLAGGGSLPEEEIPSYGLSVEFPGVSAAELHARLRRDAPIPIVGRIQDDKLLLDLRTVDFEDRHLLGYTLALLLRDPAEPLPESLQRWSG